MVHVNVLYPNSEGKHFDLAYYLNNHIPMVRAKLAPALKGVSVDQGIAGDAPGTPHADAIIGDVPNYTNIKPTIQISKVKL